MKIASRFDDKEIKKVVFSLLDYLTHVISSAETAKTLENDLGVLKSILLKNPSEFKFLAENILQEILNFMMTKYKYRAAVNFF